VVRGHKAGLLHVPDYNNLTQCETLDDVKLNLVRCTGWGGGGWSSCASACKHARVH